MKFKVHPLPYGMDVAFSVRDDDIGYFTPINNLDKIYRRAWDMGFKISFAVIPMHKGVNTLNIPPQFRNTNNYYDISQNTNLVNYFKTKLEEDKIDILQHGWSHTENQNLPQLYFDFERSCLANINGQRADLANYSEFFNMSQNETYSKIKDGRKILERTFGSNVEVFVSPQELLTRPLWVSIYKNNLSYCGNVGRDIITHVPFNHLRMSSLAKEITKKMYNNLRINNKQVAYNLENITDVTILLPTYRHYWNKFVNSQICENSYNDFKRIFSNKVKENGYFILLTHNFEYFYDWSDEITQKNQYNYFYNAIKYVNSVPNVWKCTITELANWINARNNIRIKEGYKEIKIMSKFDIRGLTLISNCIKTRSIASGLIEEKENDDLDKLVLNIKSNQLIKLPLK